MIAHITLLKDDAAVQQALNLLVDEINRLSSGSSPPVAVSNVIVWPSATPWSSVYAQLTIAGGSGIIIVPNDGAHEMTPSGFPTDLSGVWFLGMADADGNLPIIDIDSLAVGGFTLGGRGQIQSKDVFWQSYYEIGSGPSTTWTFDGGGFTAMNANNAWRGNPAAGAAFFLKLRNRAIFDGRATTDAIVTFIRGAANVELLTGSILGSRSFRNNALLPPWPSATVNKDASSTIDSSAWQGTFTPYTVNFLDRANSVFYDDGIALPTTGSVNVQAICDWLKVNYGAPLPHLIYVDAAYVGVASNGSISRPFVTIQDALNSIPGTPTRLQRYGIMCAPGIYPDPIALRPWAFILGTDAFVTRITTPNITLPAALWNPASVDPDETDVRTGFQSVTLSQAITFDFNVGPNPPSAFNGSNEGKIYFTDVITNGMLTLLAFSSINQTQHRHCQLFGGMTQSGMQVQFEESAQVGGNPIIVGNRNAATVVPAVFQSFGGATNGDLQVTSDGAAPATVNNLGFCIEGVLTLSGATATFNDSCDGPPDSVVLLAGAVAPSMPPVRVGSSSGPLVSTGVGTPEGAVVGSVGDLFLRTNGGAGTTLYVKESGTATNTGWIGK